VNKNYEKIWQENCENYDIYTRCHYYVVEPESLEEAVNEAAWRKGMQEEIEVIEKNKTWELNEKPNDKEAIGVKWVYKIKNNPDGKIQNNKARSVAKGYLDSTHIN